MPVWESSAAWAAMTGGGLTEWSSWGLGDLSDDLDPFDLDLGLIRAPWLGVGHIHCRLR